MTVEWFRCQNKLYTSLKILDSSNEEFDDLFGVYIIWSELKIIIVGSGYIRECLSDHKKDSEILATPTLQVAWAEVPIEELVNVVFKQFLA